MPDGNSIPQGITSDLVRDVRELVSRPLPADVLSIAKHSVLDWMAGTVSAAKEPLAVMVAAEAVEQGGRPAATILVTGARTSPALAALANGSAADAHDYADSNKNMRGHSTPGVVAAALAVAEQRGLTGLDFLTGVVAGVEMECRVGLLVDISNSPFHPTGNLAPFGTTAAVAHLTGLDDARWCYALGVAATLATGLRASGGTMSKPLHSGAAAMNGVLAAGLAGRGFLSRPDAIEADYGFRASRNPLEGGAEAVAAARGGFLIRDTVFKTYAACMLTHSTILNMAELRDKHGVGPQDIAAISLRVPQVAISVCNIAEPTTPLEAKFSLRATAAMTLLGDDMGSLGSYEGGRATRAEVRDLWGRVSVAPEAEFNQNGFSAAQATLTDGRVIEVGHPPIGPTRDIAEQRDVESAKLLTLAGPQVGESAAAELRDLVLQLEELNSLEPVIRAATVSANG
jgi:2-methylcitrate dehydratase PrpD